MKMKWRIAWSCVGISAGIIAGPMFAFQYHNWSTASLCLTSTLCACYLCYLHVAYMKRWMDSWQPSTFRASFWINLFIAVTTICGMVLCLVLAGVRHQTLSEDGLQGENLWMTAVWCWMTSKWSSMSAVFARRYGRKTARPIIKDPSASAPATML